MREKKRIPNFFSYRDCDDFANYLNRQAKKGWHFREFRLGLVFEKGEPRDTFYRVEVFPKGSEDDFRGDRDTEEYADYCEEAGWKFVDSVRKFCVFEQDKGGRGSHRDGRGAPGKCEEGGAGHFKETLVPVVYYRISRFSGMVYTPRQSFPGVHLF